MFLIIDNYDSFVYNLVRYVHELDETTIVKRNDAITIEEIVALRPEGIIISPGPKRPDDAGMSKDIVRKLKNQVPILGICLGHQVIGQVFGAKVIEGRAPVHGKVSSIYHNETGLYKGIPTPFNATRYHSLVIDPKSLPKELMVTSKTIDGEIMGVCHRNYFLEGVQFHPEAELTEYGHVLLQNFINRCGKQEAKWKS